VLIVGATAAAFTVSVAAALVTIPAVLLTTTAKVAPLSAVVVAGVCTCRSRSRDACAVLPLVAQRCVPVATTVNVAVWPTDTSGWKLGHDSWRVRLVPEVARVSPVQPTPVKVRTNGSRGRILWRECSFGFRSLLKIPRKKDGSADSVNPLDIHAIARRV